MASTLPTLINVQTQRLLALPEKAADNAFRTWALDAVQRRNALLDAVFYDVGAVADAEIGSLAFWLAREGALLIVPPAGAGALAVCLDKAGFLARGGTEVAALVVAGVGSSALGAAAFARNVADALDGPVAAVVSGYGLSDVLTEALGGFFWFGALNGLRHGFEGLDHFTKNFTGSEPALGCAAEWLRLSKDTATLIDLLGDPEFRVPLLVGHSKGNLVISEALYALESKGTLAAVAERCQIVTISAKVGMPGAFKGKVVDVMGQWDAFGALNSRPDIPADLVVPGAWHSTNPEFPMGMGIDVATTMRAVMPLFGRPRTRPRLAAAAAVLDLPQRMAGAAAA